MNEAEEKLFTRPVQFEECNEIVLSKFTPHKWSIVRAINIRPQRRPRRLPDEVVPLVAACKRVDLNRLGLSAEGVPLEMHELVQKVERAGYVILVRRFRDVAQLRVGETVAKGQSDVRADATEDESERLGVFREWDRCVGSLLVGIARDFEH